jgi:hypothetical protein
MNNTEALQFAQERLNKISYQLEMTSKLPCRSFYEKQQDMLIQAISALREKQEREKGCSGCVVNEKLIRYHRMSCISTECKNCVRIATDHYQKLEVDK